MDSVKVDYTAVLMAVAGSDAAFSPLVDKYFSPTYARDFYQVRKRQGVGDWAVGEGSSGMVLTRYAAPITAVGDTVFRRNPDPSAFFNADVTFTIVNNGATPMVVSFSIPENIKQFAEYTGSPTIASPGLDTTVSVPPAGTMDVTLDASISAGGSLISSDVTGINFPGSLVTVNGQPLEVAIYAPCSWTISFD